MTNSKIHSAFSLVKKVLPKRVSRLLRSFGTALLGPIFFAHQTGYWKSAFREAAISKSNKPLPWYTYPSIKFLETRDYTNRVVLEFGGGQSTLWWAERSRRVITLEGDKAWYETIKEGVPENVRLEHVSMESMEENVNSVQAILAQMEEKEFDVIIIDGLYRFEMIQIAIDFLSDDGVIVCDNSEGYGFYEGFKDRDFERVDFFGNAPGVALPHSTSVLFKANSFLFKPTYKIPDGGKWD